MDDVIDREKIERQCRALIKSLDSGTVNDFIVGELHGLRMVLNGFYLKNQEEIK